MSRVVLASRRLERVGDPVGLWLGRVAVAGLPAYSSSLRRFLVWLNMKPGWVGVGARELLLRQMEAEDQYVVLDLLQEYVSGLWARTTASVS